MTPDPSVQDLLVTILSKLSVYQSLQEFSGPVITVTSDLSMPDALCMFLPTPTGGSTSQTIVEVLPSYSLVPPATPDCRSATLLAVAQRVEPIHPTLGRVLAEEARSIQDPDSRDFLTVRDLLYYVTKILQGVHKRTNLTVNQWLDFKRSVALSERADGDRAWWLFCIQTVLIRRLSTNLSQGMSLGSSGSSMNLSVSNLLSAETLTKKKSRPGGSCLLAVDLLLQRPWQDSLPLHTFSEQQISATFSYTTLAQLMAHVCLNCVDWRLEPFFSRVVHLDEFLSVAESRLSSTPRLTEDATVMEVIDALTGSDLVILTDPTGNGRGYVTAENVLSIISQRVELIAASSGEDSGLVDLCEMRVLNLEKIEVVKFPLEFGDFIGRILVNRNPFVFISGQGVTEPLGIVTVRDVWNHVMKK